jgi:16S rRNA (guanine527-N7)-methyltransferase
MNEFIEAFQKRTHKEAFELSHEEIEKLAIHYQMMVKWNKTHNLTRIVSIQDAIEKHYVDCILGLEFVGAETPIHDLGSGAGFPGLVGAVLRPDQQFILIEPARKRTSFLNQIKTQLGLSNVSVVQDRAESLNKVACTLSRGTFSWPNYMPLTNALDIGGAAYLWIGQTPTQEDYCHALQKAGFEVSWESYQLGKSGTRHVGIAINGQ